MTGSCDGAPDRAATLVAGDPAVGFGKVWHRRNRPKVHQFTYRVNQLWLDPDDPEALCDNHRLWSASRRRPIRFRRQDYFDGTDTPIGPRLKTMLSPLVGHEPDGPIRMLTQPRTWGWMFNPITVYLAWDGEGASDPVGAVLEVTNTPWKERFMYPLALEQSAAGSTARFSKQLHVSPFLGQDYDYVLSVRQRPDVGPDDADDADGAEEAGETGRLRPDRRLSVAVDVHNQGPPPEQVAAQPLLQTSLELGLYPPDHRTMTRALYRNPAPTHRVSLGIHWQAARLARKRVPFISHPGK